VAGLGGLLGEAEEGAGGLGGLVGEAEGLIWGKIWWKIFRNIESNGTTSFGYQGT
jgi:hypothetical protein